MGRFEPTGPVDVPGLEHSVANLSWGVLAGALGPSAGSAGAGGNVPSALGVVRHAAVYAAMPSEITEAFGVLENHVMRGGRLYPVVLATLPFLFDTLRRGSIVSGRIATVIARYAAASRTLDKPLAARLIAMIGDQSDEIVRWLGRDAEHDRAVGALAIHVASLREVYLAAIEGAQTLSPDALLALAELGEAPGESTQIALAMLDAPGSTTLARTCAAAFLARDPGQPADVRTRVDAALAPSAEKLLQRHVEGLWTPAIVRAAVAPELFDVRVVFTSKRP